MKTVYTLVGITFFIMAIFQLFWLDFDEMGYFCFIAILCLALIESFSKKEPLESDIRTLNFKIKKLEASSKNNNKRHSI